MELDLTQDRTLDPLIMSFVGKIYWNDAMPAELTKILVSDVCPAYLGY